MILIDIFDLAAAEDERHLFDPEPRDGQASDRLQHEAITVRTRGVDADRVE